MVGCAIADLTDFYTLLEAESNPDLAMFQEEWLDRATLPSYRFGGTTVASEDGWGLAIRLAQSEDDVFMTPIDARVEYVDGSTSELTIYPDSADTVEVICTSREVIDVQLDPRSFVPKMAVTNINVDPSEALEVCGGGGGCTHAGRSNGGGSGVLLLVVGFLLGLYLRSVRATHP